MIKIKGFEDYAIIEDGKVWSFNRNRWLNIFIGTDGYIQTRIYKQNKKHGKQIHRLVAEAFIPNPGNKPQINHINGIKTDNRVENLEWVTRSENMKHAFSIGLCENTRILAHNKKL